jgi:protein SCO1/2
MNNPNHRSPALRAMVAAAAFALTLSLPACDRPVEEPPLKGTVIGGPFTLINQDGKRVSDRDFAGSYRLIYFGYTWCPDICPTDLQKLASGFRLLEKDDAALAARIQPIFITVDPERDSPSVVKTYVAAFHPRLIGLTGTPDEIAKVAKQFAVYREKVPAKDGGPNYLMNHSTQAVLFDPQGMPLALIPTDKTPAVVEAELRRWAR